MFGSGSKLCAPLLLVAIMAGTGSVVFAADKEQPQIPTCDKKIGSLSVVEPEQKWWVQSVRTSARAR